MTAQVGPDLQQGPPESPSGAVATDPGILAAYMRAYGLDARARSALRALGRLPEIEAAAGDWVVDLVARLSEACPQRTCPDHESDGRLRTFIDLFVRLPARDFDPDWLNDLANAWIALCRAGWDAGLPMRVAHGLGQQCIAALRRGRDSFSRLDAEIALAIGSSGLLVCAILADVERAGQQQQCLCQDAAPYIDGGGNRLKDVLSTVLATAGGTTTGILIGELDAGSTTTRTMDDEGWSLVCARALSRLRGVLRDKDVLCRMGRARFAVVLPKLNSEAQVTLAAARVARAFDGPAQVGGQEFRLLARVGAAWAPMHAESPALLLRCANLALHEASRLGRTIEKFAPAMLENVERESQIEDEFLRALDYGGLELHYQPQLDLQTGRCTGVEALLRWPRAGAGHVPPPKTVQVAERLGAMPQLTRWILHQACRAAAEFGRVGVAVEIGVNLTASDVADPELPLAVRNAIDLWHVAPRLLKFELTETAMLANEEVSARVMGALRELGVGTSIDDFGTGYSSVILLKKLPLNELKLDRCFVSGVVHSRQDREIVRSLILLAHSLGLEVVAEGVEDVATLDLLRDFGCDRAQGYLFSRPVAAAQFLAWLQNHESGEGVLRGDPRTSPQTGC